MARSQAQRSNPPARSVAPRSEPRKRSSRVLQETECTLRNHTSDASTNPPNELAPAKPMRNCRSLAVDTATMERRRLRSTDRDNRLEFRSHQGPLYPTSSPATLACEPSTSRHPLSLANLVAHDEVNPAPQLRSASPTEVDDSPEFLAQQLASSSKPPLARLDSYPLSLRLVGAHDQSHRTFLIPPTTPPAMTEKRAARRSTSPSRSESEIISRDFAFTPAAEADRKRNAMEVERRALELLREIEAVSARPPPSSLRSKGKGRAVGLASRDIQDCYMQSGMSKRELQDELRRANAARLLCDVTLGSLGAVKEKLEEAMAPLELKHKITKWNKQVTQEIVPPSSSSSLRDLAPSNTTQGHPRVLRSQYRPIRPLPQRRSVRIEEDETSVVIVR